MSLCHGVYRFSFVVRTSTKKQKGRGVSCTTCFTAGPLGATGSAYINTERELNTSTVAVQVFPSEQVLVCVEMRSKASERCEKK